ncbi:MAG: NAD(P)H-hydrate dehydratase [Halieaceae bacterium]|nr:NAD(P)H-hydrate dehydratase [Halieaceae bacterium]
MFSESLYTAEQTRELDRRAIEDCGIPGAILMSRAGRAAFDCIQQRWPEGCPLMIFCGTGNNGGDGFVVAALAAARRVPVTVIQVGDPERVRGDAAAARQAALDAGVDVRPFAGAPAIEDCLVVDGLLGTGLSKPLQGEFRDAVAAINASGQPVLALDIPSGLCSDTGAVLGDAVVADATITFIGVKQGLLTGEAPGCVGELLYADLEVPADVYAGITPGSQRLALENELEALPRLSPVAHKGHFGHALVVGGDLGMAGAAIMAAEAAGRCGAGLVSAATRAAHVPALVARQPEVMAHGVEARAGLEKLLAAASAVAVGPGLGKAAWGEQMLQLCLQSDCPLVVDADALNLLAADNAASRPPRGDWILTPHPGEAARLLGCDTTRVQADRFAAARALQQRYQGVVVLKGSGTLVCDAEGVYVCTYGNPGMATGGMGDVLSGVLVGLLAQGLSLSAAARLGVCLHSAAADLAAEQGVRGLLPTDLMPALRALLDD